MMRLTSGPTVKLNPRNFRSCGRATALFAAFTLSLSCCVMKRLAALVDSNGKEITLPSIVETYEGEKATVTGFSAPKWKGSTGQLAA